MIRQIHPERLFIGNAMDARDLRLLYNNRIAAVVDLAANEPPAQLARDIICCRIPIIDGDGNPNAIIEIAVRCVVMLIENDIRTMVACSAGMSRSPAIAAAAIAILTVANCKITDAGLEHLRSLQKLERMDISSRSVTDAGLKHLRELGSLKSLSLSIKSLNLFAGRGEYWKVGLRQQRLSDKLQCLKLKGTASC